MARKACTKGATRGHLGVMVIAIAAGAVGLSGCSSSNGGAGAGGGECKTGANAAFATPAGTPFALPSGVTLEGEITGDIGSPSCLAADTVEYGGDLLPVCFGLRNATAASITVTLPAGLTFIPKDAATQNGIMLQEHKITVRAGEVTYFRIDLFCLNEHCAYGKKQDRFTFGNVSNDAGILELIGLVRGRKLTRDATNTAAALTRAVWDITGGRGLSEERKRQLAEIPDGT